MTRPDASSPMPAVPVLATSTRAPAAHSRFVQRVRRRYGELLPLLAPGQPGPDDFRSLFDALRGRGYDVAAALRILRQLVLERLVRRDIEELAPLEDVTHGMTALAEFALDVACRHTMDLLDTAYGPALAETGAPARFWIMGMGKLGARELNVSSDIDLIFIYDQDGETRGNSEGRNRISVHEYFAKAVRGISQLLSDTTEHGFVFRVDLALRPNGNSGPPAISLGALEEYFQVQGREWERFAWLKSRVVAPRRHLMDGSVMALRSLILPFVFRRYLDYGVFEALRNLHRQIRDHASKRSAGHPERSKDVKLSRGGIREIEFIVQLLQVVRGGQYPELRTRPTLDALQRLVRASLMPAATADSLARAYVFLRQVEHRIQYLDDQQTHLLPNRDDDLEWIAHSLNLPDVCRFLAEFDAHRELVAQEFDTLLGGAGPRPCRGCKGQNKADGAVGVTEDLDSLLSQLPPLVRDRVQGWRDHPRVLALREESRQRLLRLVARTSEWLREGRVTQESACRLVDWMEPLLRRESYLAMLLERPAVHERLLRLLGAARWPARYLMQHPGVIDELSGRNLMDERFDATVFEAELETRYRALHAAGDADEEALLNLLRRAHHAEVFRTLARDVEGALAVEQVADDLSALADAVLRTTLRWCWDRLKKRHRAEPMIAIIGYGKLGGKELGYGSDLDIVFVFEDDHEDAPEIYAQLVRKLINWLTVKTGEGDLYEIDTALRPNGNSGLLITTFQAYAQYQQQRGSNTAWTWEHQAMTRARFVLGQDSLRLRFDAVRQAVICAERDADALRREIMGMRDRVRQAHPVRPGRFDVKHSPGGMVDAEFAVQYLVLTHGRQHPSLIVNSGNIALLQAAEHAGLLATGIGHAAGDAYRELRRLQHRARLDESPTDVDPVLVSAQSSAILALWGQVFGI